jgi:hypothetical protein
MEQDLLTLPEYLGSPPVVTGIHVAQSLVFGVILVSHCFSFCPFSFGHCYVHPSSVCLN